MKNILKIKNIIKILAFLTLTSCSFAKKESPTIYISNLTKNPIDNITVNFPNHSIKVSTLKPGNTATRTFIIKGPQDFFANISMSWQNYLKEESQYNFTIKEDHLKSFFNKKLYSYVQIYIKDFDADILYYDDYNSGNIMAEKDVTLRDLRIEYQRDTELKNSQN